MTYNSELQSNNADLQAILDTVNALPEASSGPSVETCTVNVSVSGTGVSITSISYTTVADGEVSAVRYSVGAAEASISCLCGSLVVVVYSRNCWETENTNSEYLGYIHLSTIRPYKITAGAGETANIVVEKVNVEV